MIDEALAAVAIELQPLVEVLLLEDDAVVNAGDIAAGARFAGADGVVIRFFAAGERGEQVVADRADVELVQMAAVRGRDERDQPVAGEADFGAGVEVVVVGREFDPRFVAFGKAAVLRPRRAGCRQRSGVGRRRCAGAAGRRRRTRRASSRSCIGRGRARRGPDRVSDWSLERPVGRFSVAD